MGRETNMETIVRTFPVLFSRNKKSLRRWSISVKKRGEDVMIETVYGQNKGKMIHDERAIRKLTRGHDTLEEQAVAEAESKWKHKRDRERYTETPDDRPVITPMLAQTFTDGRHLVFPLHVQPKIDGIRCLAGIGQDGQVELRSRTNVLMVSPHLDGVRLSLRRILDSCNDKEIILDGELFSDEIPFEELSGLCRQKLATGATLEKKKASIVFHVFDAITPGSFRERLEMITTLLERSPAPHVRLTPTFVADTIESAMEWQREFVGQGYEGLILRNSAAPYQMIRSKNLQKHKTFQEEEFVIVGFSEGAGRDAGTVIWECQSNADPAKRFHVRPRGSHEFRSNLFREASSRIGQKLTVIFQEYTQDGIPRFPVGKSIRVDC